MFITTLFILISNQKISKYPSLVKWINKMRQKYLKNYDLAINIANNRYTQHG